MNWGIFYATSDKCIRNSSTSGAFLATTAAQVQKLEKHRCSKRLRSVILKFPLKFLTVSNRSVNSNFAEKRVNGPLKRTCSFELSGLLGERGPDVGGADRRSQSHEGLSDELRAELLHPVCSSFR